MSKRVGVNKFQRAVCLNYGGGDYAHIADSPTPLDDCADVGDTLFTFIMRELADENIDNPMTRGEAVKRMERAKDDLEGVLWQIDRS